MKIHEHGKTHITSEKLVFPGPTAKEILSFFENRKNLANPWESQRFWQKTDKINLMISWKWRKPLGKTIGLRSCH